MFGFGSKDKNKEKVDEQPKTETKTGNSSDITEKDVLRALSYVIDPDLHRDIVSLGMVKEIKICNRDLAFTVELTTPACPLKEKIEKDCRDEIKKNLPPLDSLNIKMSSNVKSFNTEKNLMKYVKNVIAVASGKGGVGKSTASANIALSLAATGAKVGLLDADIYGPTIPALLGVKEYPAVTEDKKMIPINKNGLKLMSIGFLLKDNEPVVWRGPMVGGVITQFLRDVDWGELDYLIVDLPPGTGDAQLTLAQAIPLSGVVIISTPEDVALNIATKALAMFKNLRVPILGVIENMSYFVAPDTGNIYYIFGKGGGKNICEKLDVKFLGEVPLDIAIREGGDEGKPISFFRPESEQAKAFKDVAGNIASSLSTKILTGV